MEIIKWRRVRWEKRDSRVPGSVKLNESGAILANLVFEGFLCECNDVVGWSRWEKHHQSNGCNGQHHRRFGAPHCSLSFFSSISVDILCERSSPTSLSLTHTHYSFFSVKGTSTQLDQTRKKLRWSPVTHYFNSLFLTFFFFY